MCARWSWQAIFAGAITLFCQIVGLARSSGAGSGAAATATGAATSSLFLVIAMVVGAVGYFLAIVIRMAISRTREYVADAGSVELTHNPDWCQRDQRPAKRSLVTPTSKRR